MAASYDEALDELYRAAHESFVSERKRLAATLKAAGDKAGATRLLARGRPPLSAWAVNQLWWQARAPFADLLAASERLRAGDQSAASDRREALASLKASAASILLQAGHGANEGTLRRVATTLAALAAAGGFDPDPPGALSADRDPPGFDVALLGGAAPAAIAPSTAPARTAGGAPVPAEPVAPPARAVRPALKVVPPPAAASSEAGSTRAPETPDAVAAPQAPPVSETLAREQAERLAREEAERVAREQAEHLAREEAERVAREQAERLRIEQDQKRLEAERAARIAERQRLTASLPALRADLERRQREVERLQAEVRRVSGLATEARAAIDAAESRLQALSDDG